MAAPFETIFGFPHYLAAAGPRSPAKSSGILNPRAAVRLPTLAALPLLGFWKSFDFC